MQNNKRIHIPAPKDFSLSKNLVYLSRSPDECLHKVIDSSVYKVLSSGNSQVLVSVRQNGEGLVIESVHREFTGEEKKIVKKYVAEWFDLLTDLLPFYEFAETDEKISMLLQNYRGIRIIGIPDLFEALCWSVIGQQINLKFAYTLKKNLVETAGESMAFDGHKLYSFPKPGKVTELNLSELRDMQFSRQKAEYLRGIAEMFETGKISKEALSDLNSYHNIKAELMKIRGIGEWSADYVIMRCLRIYEALPASDAGLINALKNQFNLDKKPTAAEVKQIGEAWGKWKSYVVFYLWRSLINETIETEQDNK